MRKMDLIIKMFCVIKASALMIKDSALMIQG